MASRVPLPVTHVSEQLPSFFLLHLKSTSSSGQDVALWPRQPRFKSWCGHFGGMATLPLPCQLLRAACPLALGPCPPRVHRAWHSGVVPRRRQHRQAMGQRMAGAGCARQAPPLPVNHASR